MQEWLIVASWQIKRKTYQRTQQWTHEIDNTLADLRYFAQWLFDCVNTVCFHWIAKHIDAAWAWAGKNLQTVDTLLFLLLYKIHRYPSLLGDFRFRHLHKEEKTALYEAFWTFRFVDAMIPRYCLRDQDIYCILYTTMTLPAGFSCQWQLAIHDHRMSQIQNVGPLNISASNTCPVKVLNKNQVSQSEMWNSSDQPLQCEVCQLAHGSNRSCSCSGNAFQATASFGLTSLPVFSKLHKVRGMEQTHHWIILNHGSRRIMTYDKTSQRHGVTAFSV